MKADEDWLNKLLLGGEFKQTRSENGERNLKVIRKVTSVSVGLPCVCHHVKILMIKQGQLNQFVFDKIQNRREEVGSFRTN